jgi:outer membrane protein
MSIGFKGFWLGAVAAAAVIAPAAASAETLAEAMALAYESNPQLQSQRALQRQTDEVYVQARAGWRLTSSVAGLANYRNEENPNQPNRTQQRRLTATLSLSQPLFTGGRVAAQVDAADAQVRAGRETLRLIEAQVLQQVIQAYQDVLRDQQMLAIRQQSLDVLSRQLTETQARFEAGLITRTDTARAEAQVALARAQLATARAALQNSRAAYTAVVGRAPGELITPAVLPGLPADIDAAFDALEANSPTLRRSILVEEASRARVAQVRAGRMPTVSLSGTYGTVGNWSPTFDPLASPKNITAQVNVSVPLVTGGVLSSQIRAATEQNTSDRILIEQARRTAIQNLTTAWNQMLSAQANIRSNEEQVRAATVAFEGSQEQFRVGLATTLDTLLAQDTLRFAQLALVQSRRDLYVAQAQVLAAVGGLEMLSLADNAPYYDPQANFQRVRNKGALPWEGLVRAIDLDKDSEDVRPGSAPTATDPAGEPVLKPGVAPAVLQDADAALSAAEPTRPSTPPAGGATTQ